MEQQAFMKILLKNMKKIILYLIFSAFITSSLAQNVTVGLGGKPLLKSIAKSNIQGSPYFNSYLTTGKIKTAGQQEFEVKNLRYNLETQQLEYIENSNIYAVQDAIQSFMLTDSLGKLNEFHLLQSGSTTGFYKIIANGNPALLKQYSTSKESVQDWYTKKTLEKLVHHDQYFTNKAGVIQKLIPSAKSLSKIMADKEAAVTTMIKSEQLNPKREDDLIKIFNFYNSLK